MGEKKSDFHNCFVHSGVFQAYKSDRKGLTCLHINAPFQNCLNYHMMSAGRCKTVFMGDLCHMKLQLQHCQIIQENLKEHQISMFRQLKTSQPYFKLFFQLRFLIYHSNICMLRIEETHTKLELTIRNLFLTIRNLCLQ